jgi:hypothetical protein
MRDIRREATSADADRHTCIGNEEHDRLEPACVGMVILR